MVDKKIANESVSSVLHNLKSSKTPLFLYDQHEKLAFKVLLAQVDEQHQEFIIIVLKSADKEFSSRDDVNYKVVSIYEQQLLEFKTQLLKPDLAVLAFPEIITYGQVG